MGRWVDVLFRNSGFDGSIAGWARYSQLPVAATVIANISGELVEGRHRQNSLGNHYQTT